MTVPLTPLTNNSTLQPAAPWLAAIGLALACAASAHWQLFTTFRFWDDEGYVLISLRNFASGGSLYSDVYSQYGPFYNLLFGFGHRFLQMPLDAGAARCWVGFVWVAVALSSFAITVRLTRSTLWGLAGGLALFCLLRPLTNEPMHPVGLIALLLAVGTAWAAADIANDREVRALVIASGTGVLLAFIKINVGAFYLVGVGVFAALSCASPRWCTWAGGTLAASSALAGCVLMRPLLHEPWVKTFALLYAVAAATTLITLTIDIAPALRSRRPFLAIGLTVAGASALVLGSALLVGIAPPQLLEGIVLGPLRHPTAFSFPFRWSGLTLPILVCNAAAFLAWLVLRRSRPVVADRIVAIARLVVFAGFFGSFFHAFAVSVEGFLLSFATGFSWALTASLNGEPPGQKRARQFLAVPALLQILHAYPVAGSQLGVGTMLLALALVLPLADTVRWLRTTWPARPAFAFAATAAPAALGLVLWGFASATGAASARYFRSPAETFTGAGLHLSPWQTSTIATLTANARYHGDLLFSLPGMFSFNLWTGLPSPTLANVTQWWALLSDSRQAEIATRLMVYHRSVIIVQRYLITEGIHRQNYRPSLLSRAIDENFVQLFSLDTYEFWVRRGAVVRPLDIGRWRTDAPHAFTFCSTRADLETARRIEFHRHGFNTDEVVGSVTRFERVHSDSLSDRLIEWTFAVTSGCPDTGLCDAARFYDAADRIVAEVRFPRPGRQASPE